MTLSVTRMGRTVKTTYSNIAQITFHRHGLSNEIYRPSLVSVRNIVILVKIKIIYLLHCYTIIRISTVYILVYSIDRYINKTSDKLKHTYSPGSHKTLIIWIKSIKKLRTVPTAVFSRNAYHTGFAVNSLFLHTSSHVPIYKKIPVSKFHLFVHFITQVFLSPWPLHIHIIHNQQTRSPIARFSPYVTCKSCTVLMRCQYKLQLLRQSWQ